MVCNPQLRFAINLLHTINIFFAFPYGYKRIKVKLNYIILYFTNILRNCKQKYIKHQK